MIKRSSFGLWAGIAVSCFVVLVASQLAVHWVTREAAVSFPTRQGWYAVFLSDGQVYFGKIVGEDERTVTLRNIFYIQTPSTDQKTASQGDISLLKLGTEIHEPEDWMEINRDRVAFIEQLQDQGKVVKAIEAYKPE